MGNEITKEKQAAILRHEIETQKEFRYLMIIRARVATATKNKQNLETCEKELANIEIALDVLKAELAKVASDEMSPQDTTQAEK